MANGINGLSRVMEGPRPEVQCMGLRDAVPPTTLATRGESQSLCPDNMMFKKLVFFPDGEWH